MAFVQKNKFSVEDFSQKVNGEVQYPAVVHFRIIADATAELAAPLAAVLAKYKVVQKPQMSNASSSGHYQAYGLSLEIQNAEEMVSIDRELKAIPGVRMVL